MGRVGRRKWQCLSVVVEIAQGIIPSARFRFVVSWFLRPLAQNVIRCQRPSVAATAVFQQRDCQLGAGRGQYSQKIRNQSHPYRHNNHHHIVVVLECTLDALLLEKTR